MSQSFKPYLDYEESGVAWIGEMPSHWRLQRTKTLFDRMQRPVRPNDGIVTAFRDGEVTLRSNRRTDGFTNAAKEIGYQGVRVNDLIVHAMDGFAGAIGVSDSEGKCSPVYSVCTPKRTDQIHVAYYGYLVRQLAVTDFINSLAKGIRERSTEFRYSEFSSLYLAVPSLAEQQQIASFLDYETAKIDALMEKQQQLIALLGEKRQAVISHAVTKGLNPDAPMRDSGVEWLGEVPEHWTVNQLRRWIAEMEQGKSPECENRPAVDGEWAVLKTGCVNGGIYNEEQNKALPPAISPLKEYEVREGDVLMSRASGSTDLIGSVAYVDATRSLNLLSDKIFRIRFWAGIDGKFFRYFMASSFMRDTIVRSISGAEGMANNITKTAILGFQGALPPLKEQIAIVAHIEKTTGRMQNLIERAEDALMLLRERRTALISAAVTGKIDVRGWKRPSADTTLETEMEVA